jgi:hypothetical protein
MDVMENQDDKQKDLTTRLFDETEYASMFVHTDGAVEKHKAQIKDLIELVSKEKYRSTLLELYRVLKNEKASIHLIFDALETKEGQKHAAVLYAAIWESGLDASEYIVDMVSAFFSADIETAVEIFTVITNNCENVENEKIDEALDVFKERAPKVSDDKKELSLEILDWLENNNGREE